MSVLLHFRTQSYREVEEAILDGWRIYTIVHLHGGGTEFDLYKVQNYDTRA